MAKNHKCILCFSQRLAYVSARSKRNSERARRALSPGPLKSAGRSSRRREKRQSCVGNDVFLIFYGILMFFDAFTIFRGCFELSECF